MTLSSVVESVPLIGTSRSVEQAQASDAFLKENRRITEGYVQLAYEVQTLLDPELQPGLASDVWPNWFVYAPHASYEAGKGMYCAALVRRLIDAARCRPTVPLERLLEEEGVTGAMRETTEPLTRLLQSRGVPSEAAIMLGVFLSALNWKALLDPRTAVAVTSRFYLLYLQAPGLLPMDKAETVVRTLERTLYEGNVAIFSDIGGSGRAFLRWRSEAQGQLTPARVLSGFSRPGSQQEQARRAYDFGWTHAAHTPRPSDFARLLPTVTPQSLVVAAFALYEAARLEAGLAARQALIAMANNFVAWCEQLAVVQPCFVPPRPPAGEVSRPALMQALTALLRLDFGTLEWAFTDYASTQPDRDDRFLTSRPTEYNWALFEDRWPAILHAFEGGYRAPMELWKMPRPLVD
jgi:hypothetical protein